MHNIIKIHTFTKTETKHFDRLTDDFGIWQHTDGENIHKEKGYALDDAARGLILALQIKDARKCKVFFNFILRAVRKDQIINFFDHKRLPIDYPYSQDALGEVVWALGECIKTNYRKTESFALVGEILPIVKRFNYIRARAYALLGLIEINKEIALQYLYGSVKYFKFDTLISWPESGFSYANAIIPLALIKSGEKLFRFNKRVLSIGIKYLNFLNAKTKHWDIPISIGNKKWHEFGKEKSLFDQQPIDPAYQVLANIAAYKATQQKTYLKEALLYFTWFWGNNIKKAKMIDEEYLGCKDGIEQNGLSKNMGAESIICYLLAQEAVWEHIADKKSG